ncbi:MAG: PTO1314 family radical SAM protein [Thermoprotei archaeon]
MAVLKPVLLGGIHRSMRLIKGAKLPLIAGHKLLYSCNLRCRMCPFWRREDEELLSVEEEVKLLDSLKRAGVLFMGFEGGEPLLRRDIAQVLMESNKRFHTSMVTNGWLLKTRMHEVKDYLNFLFVSLDGPPHIHDQIRGITGSFNKAIEGIKEAKKHLDVAISHTIMSANLEYTEDMVKLAQKLGVGISIQVAYNYNDAEGLSPNRERLRHTLERLLELKRRGAPIIESEGYFKAILSSWYGGASWVCKPWLTINIDPQGRIVLPCYALSEYHGEKRVWETDLTRVWNTYPWEKFESCNNCALACYLEPSLFSWKSFSNVNERILHGAFSYVLSKTGLKHRGQQPQNQ